jgi:hypothetical protein
MKPHRLASHCGLKSCRSNLVLGYGLLQGAYVQQTNQVYILGFLEDIDVLLCFLSKK